MPTDEKEQPCADLLADLLKPLLKVVENSTNSAADTYFDALSRAYRRRTDAGVAERALWVAALSVLGHRKNHLNGAQIVRSEIASIRRELVGRYAHRPKIAR